MGGRKAYLECVSESVEMSFSRVLFPLSEYEGNMFLSPPDSRSDANRPARMFFFRGEGKGALAVSVDKSRAADRGANGPWR